MRGSFAYIFLVTVLGCVSMPFQLFIPGKNWCLSLAELASFFEARGIKFSACAVSKEFFVFSVEEKVDAAIINDLGGTIKIGASVANFSTEIVQKAFLQKDRKAQAQISRTVVASGLVGDMLETESAKVLFGVSVYCTEKSLRQVSKVIQRFIGSAIKRELVMYSKKAQFMGFAKDRKYPQLSHIEVLKKKLVENKAEVLFCIGKEQTWISTTLAVHNPFEFQKRDIGKPNQRKIFAMPPRLARIMVNLASCKAGQLLLDPFCGVGTILQEALLAKARVVGMDINPWCVKATVENLEWLKREYGLAEAEFRILQGDACRLTHKIGQEQVDSVVTEPDLGPALRHVPTMPYAVKIIEKLKPLYYGLVEEAFKVLRKNGRLVLTTPYIQTRSEKTVTMALAEKAASVGFKPVFPFKKGIFAEGIMAQKNLAVVSSFVDAEERHKIGRQIHIFQK